MKGIYTKMPATTDMAELKKRLKEVKKKTGKTANKNIVEFILKLSKL